MVRFSKFELLSMLSENSRMSFVDLAKKLKVSETAVRKRVNNLMKKGIIKNFTITVDPKKSGIIVSYIGVDTRPEYYIKVIEELSKRGDIKDLYTSSGDHMIMIEYWAENNQQMNEFINYLNNLEGVTKTCPAILVEKIK